MFDFKSMGAVAGLLKNKDQLEAAAARIKDRVETMKVEGSAGGGAVRAVVTGKMRVESVTVDPSVGAGFGASADAKSMAENLIAGAVNDGIQKAQDEIAQMVRQEMRDLGIDENTPGLSGIIKGMLPG